MADFENSKPKALMVDNESYEEVVRQRNDLKTAVMNLYYAAVWHADRPVDETALWVAVRDAAGLLPGRSPKELDFNGIRLELPINKIRLLLSATYKIEVSTEQAEAFLFLFKDKLEEAINQTIRTFMEERLK